VGSIGISFIGTFNTVIPPERQLNILKQLFQEGIDLGKLTKDFKLFGARQLSSTESPGAALFDIIKTWPNFSTDID
jgi:peptidoglycan recognition protein LC